MKHSAYDVFTHACALDDDALDSMIGMTVGDGGGLFVFRQIDDFDGCFTFVWSFFKEPRREPAEVGEWNEESSRALERLSGTDGSMWLVIAGFDG